MQKIVSALALLAAASGVGEAGKAAFDPEGARIRIANANRGRIAAERAEKARFARLQKEYPFCIACKAEVYASEDGRNICGLTDGDEAVAEYRLVQFPHAEWNELADACWKAIRNGCLCILGLESAPQLLESALDQERDLGNVAESVRDAIRGKLAHARKLLKDPSFREWLPHGKIDNIDFAYADDAYEQYAKAIRSLTCQDVTRDDVDALLKGNRMLDGLLRDPDWEPEGAWACECESRLGKMRDAIRSQAARRRSDAEWECGDYMRMTDDELYSFGTWVSDSNIDRTPAESELRLYELMLGAPEGMFRVFLYGVDERDWILYWDVSPENLDKLVWRLYAYNGVCGGWDETMYGVEHVRVAFTLPEGGAIGGYLAERRRLILQALIDQFDGGYALSTLYKLHACLDLGDACLEFAEMCAVPERLVAVQYGMDMAGWDSQSIAGNARSEIGEYDFKDDAKTLVFDSDHDVVGVKEGELKVWIGALDRKL